MILSDHCSKSTIDVDDVKEAVYGRIHHSFAPPPSQEFIKDLALEINHTPLPPIQDKFGVRLPLEKYCLSATNYQIVPDASSLGINRHNSNRSPRPAPSEEQSPEEVNNETTNKNEEKGSPATTVADTAKTDIPDESGDQNEDTNNNEESQFGENPPATMDEAEDSDFEEVDDSLKSTD